MSMSDDLEKKSDDSRSPSTEQDPEKAAALAEQANTSASEPAPVNPWDPSQFPDGGFAAWITVAGAFCFIFCSFGWVNCIGTFQAYYEQHYLSNYSASTISWIASLELFLMFFGGLPVGKLYDTYGPRKLFIIGAFLHVFGLMMLSLSSQYYQILLSQGICSPIGVACMWTPATNCVTGWFFKRRAFAIGIVVAGSSLGGVIFPIMLDHLIPEVGFPWAIRISAFLVLAMLIFAVAVTRSRVPPMPKKMSLRLFLQPFTEVPFVLTTVGALLFFTGIFLPINFISSQAIAFGMSPSLAGYLISILNGASLFGRVLPGFIADKVGRFNVMVVMSWFTTIMVLALWLPANSSAAIIAFAAFYGFGSGAFVSLLPAMVAQISDVRFIGVRMGLEFSMLSIVALISNPIGGAFISLNDGGYRDVKIWTGVTLAAGSVMFVFARMSLAGVNLKKVV